AADYNVVNLDNHTLKLLVGKDLPAFVRFDRDYPYGEKADAFKALAQTAVGAKILIGSVGISTYGEKMNQDLAEEFGYKSVGQELEYGDMDKTFPKFRLFPANGGASVEYTGDVTAEAMTLFLKKDLRCAQWAARVRGSSRGSCMGLHIQPHVSRCLASCLAGGVGTLRFG
ncbi:unnamed protein product, partial [Effrenium voratum]